jgi:hypothetical protein
MIPGVTDHGGRDEAAGRVPGSRLTEYAEMTAPVDLGETPLPSDASSPDSGKTSAAAPRTDDRDDPAVMDGDIARRRSEFAVLLGGFRRTAVLVPVDDDDAAPTGGFGAVRWIYAFSGEAELARFAIARGEGGLSPEQTKRFVSEAYRHGHG